MTNRGVMQRFYYNFSFTLKLIIMKKIKGVGADQMIAGPVFRAGGKSELRRAGWSLTATGGDPKESATENIPPVIGR